MVQQLLPKLQLDKLPLYALGSANGGAFALTLPMFMQLGGGWPPWYPGDIEPQLLYVCWKYRQQCAQLAREVHCWRLGLCTHVLARLYSTHCTTSSLLLRTRSMLPPQPL